MKQQASTLACSVRLNFNANIAENVCEITQCRENEQVLNCLSWNGKKSVPLWLLPMKKQ